LGYRIDDRSKIAARPMTLTLESAAVLNDGQLMPRLGFGVYGIASGGACLRAVSDALEVGYRHIDTATFYGNESDVGRAVRESGIPRERLFVVTKLWSSDQGYASAVSACELSLSRLGMDYIDLYLIHWPEPGKRLDSWRALVELRARGKCKSIGVSNYTVAHLQELMNDSDVVPAVNQIEFSPFLYQRQLLEFCRAHGIQVEAYCPLTRGKKLHDPTLGAIARKHAKTPAQVLLRWALQHDVVIIPKSQHRARITENADLYGFTLDPKDMSALDRLDEDFRTCWDPTSIS